MTPVDTLEEIRFPIGRLTIDPDITESKRRLWIAHIAALPANLHAAVDGLSDIQLNQRYRPEGWTVRQVVHHLADEHVNGFAYFKMALTEDDPVIKTYNEPLWAETKDAIEAPIELSVNLLTGLHARWAILLNSLDDKSFARAYIHRRGRISIDDGIQLYAWHCLHHTAHITELRKREGW
ncbi:MAG: YfiT family bacillithiol transferase [Blastocatellia bacterium]